MQEVNYSLLLEPLCECCLIYSHCPEHAWQMCKINPSKHSIFALGGAEGAAEECVDKEQQEAAYMQQDNTIVQAPTSPTPAAHPVGSPTSSGLSTGTKAEALKLGRSFLTCGGNAGHL